MCFKIITQKIEESNKNQTDEPKAYNLIYYPGAWAKTDPPGSFGELIAQRRRWINGSNFIFFFIVWNLADIYRSNHNIFQKAAFTFNIFVSLAQ